MNALKEQRLAQQEGLKASSEVKFVLTFEVSELICGHGSTFDPETANKFFNFND